MADLGAVLRKTIDGLPNATPELRAKVYEKARAAILRQIENANPPLSDDVIAKRTAALEDAIDETEAFYERPAAAEPAAEPLAEPSFASPRPPVVLAPEPVRPPPFASREVEEVEAPMTPAAPIPRMPRAEPDFVTTRAEPPRERRSFAHGTDRRDPTIGNSPVAPAAAEPESGFAIPDADTSAPRYSATRPPRAKSSRAPLYAGIAVLAIIAAGGVSLYGDRIAALFGGASQTADSAAGTEGADVASAPLSTTPDAAAPDAASGQAAQTPDAAPQAARRRFTQRLMPDGTEVDEGPGVTGTNAFDEGTNVAAATPEATTPAEPADAPPAAATTAPTPTAPAAAPENGAAPAVAQRAMFYEERTDNQQGTQQLGNVVWSVVNEPPADDQPPEPAIRAVADIPAENFKMTMTIRRNLDQTLPASHVVELQFDVPSGFAGGQVANVQRLALKPTEEARGQPLIGVAGKISDGFFIIALNNLDKATETNIALLGREQWIDIPIAYATGRRALLSVEKGVPGERVFKEVLEAWAAKT